MKFGLFVTCGPVINWAIRYFLYAIFQKGGNVYTTTLRTPSLWFFPNKGRYVNKTSYPGTQTDTPGTCKCDLMDLTKYMVETFYKRR